MWVSPGRTRISYKICWRSSSREELRSLRDRCAKDTGSKAHKPSCSRGKWAETWQTNLSYRRQSCFRGLWEQLQWRLQELFHGTYRGISYWTGFISYMDKPERKDRERKPSFWRGSYEDGHLSFHFQWRRVSWFILKKLKRKLKRYLQWRRLTDSIMRKEEWFLNGSPSRLQESGERSYDTSFWERLWKSNLNYRQK